MGGHGDVCKARGETHGDSPKLEPELFPDTIGIRSHFVARTRAMEVLFSRFRNVF